jgi:large subunit ribosomal protein L16
MFLRPREKKFKKEIKGKISGISNELLSFGVFGIRSLEYGRITARQIETARRIISKRVKNSGKFWVCVFPAKPITRKPNEVRMGKGKGSVSFWVSVLKPGKMLYEFEGVNLTTANKIYKSMSHKLPIKIELIYKFSDI